MRWKPQAHLPEDLKKKTWRNMSWMKIGRDRNVDNRRWNRLADRMKLPRHPSKRDELWPQRHFLHILLYLSSKEYCLAVNILMELNRHILDQMLKRSCETWRDKEKLRIFIWFWQTFSPCSSLERHIANKFTCLIYTVVGRRGGKSSLAIGGTAIIRH